MRSESPIDTAESLSSFRRALLRWYARHARDLPWRRTRDPYAIWISEIMLQQTTVVAVVPFFERFLQRFPTLRDLAAAEEDDVLRLWEGLGYYSRARNILKAARVLVAENDARFPEVVAALLKLPGIGRYTAGAIASFAFDQRAPILEANTLRLYCRLLGFDGDPRAAKGQKILWEFAGKILPRKSSGTFNQALMELGATVCTPEKPACEACPVRPHCAAAAHGRQTEIPMAAQRPEMTAVTEIAVAVQHDGRFLLMKRPPGERWAGLWDFVRFGWDDEHENGAAGRPSKRMEDERKLHTQVAGSVREKTGLAVQVTERLAELRHSVTRYRITLKCFLAESLTGALEEESSRLTDRRWLFPREFSRVPLSMTGRKIANLLCNRERESNGSI